MTSRRKFVRNLSGLVTTTSLCPYSFRPFIGKPKSKEAGLTVERQGTEQNYIAYKGRPLLAFGCHFEHLFFDNYEYEDWTRWAVEFGMNHCRARLYHAYYRDYSPFKKTADGRFDLTSWDDSFWERFHVIMRHFEENDIIVHLLIFPQGSGGHWWQGDGYYLPENNIHPETAFIRPDKSTAGFWQSLARGKTDLYEIQTAILWKLIEESAEYDNIYYDLCHEPFLHAMDAEELEDMKIFIDETTRLFFEKYQKLRPDKTPLLGIDTDFTPPGEMRDWLYSHERLNIIIQGKNHDEFYDSATSSKQIRLQFRKPYCPQESLDLPGVVHIADVKHKNSLTYFESGHRNHLRKYVWRWFMAKSQLIDIYQKGLSKKDKERERYSPWGHNTFEKDAGILREFWNRLVNYPDLGIHGKVVSGPGEVQMVLSSPDEAIIYLSSVPGVDDQELKEQNLIVSDLQLISGNASIAIWKPSYPGGELSVGPIEISNGNLEVTLLSFVDDLIVYIKK